MLEGRDWRTILWAIVGLMALAMVVSLVGENTWGWDGGYGMMGGWMWMPFLLVMLVMMFFMMGHHGHGHGGHGGHGGGHGGDARSVLDRRYAAGEISRDEYQRMREDLERRG